MTKPVRRTRRARADRRRSPTARPSGGSRTYIAASADITVASTPGPKPAVPSRDDDGRIELEVRNLEPERRAEAQPKRKRERHREDRDDISSGDTGRSAHVVTHGQPEPRSGASQAPWDIGEA